jgi:hypothetical protein
VPIQNVRELETVVREVIIGLDKHIFARVNDDKLEAARRQLIAVRDALKRDKELSERQLQTLNQTTTSLREALNDDRLNDLLWDVTDFLELQK